MSGADLIVLIIVFLIALKMTDDFFMTLIITFAIGSFVLGVGINTNTIQEGADDLLGTKTEQQVEQPAPKAETDKVGTGIRIEFKSRTKSADEDQSAQLDVSTLPNDTIYDQLRGSEHLKTVVLTVPPTGIKGCRTNGNCFKGKLRKHDDGTVYACEVDGINCYRLPK